MRSSSATRADPGGRGAHRAAPRVGHHDVLGDEAQRGLDVSSVASLVQLLGKFEGVLPDIAYESPPVEGRVQAQNGPPKTSPRKPLAE